MPLADALIAATALEHGITRVTANDKHDRMVDALEIEVL
jgi:predicted nucleic acid-binding protein